MASVPVEPSKEKEISGREETVLCSCAVGGKFFFLGYTSMTKNPHKRGLLYQEAGKTAHYTQVGSFRDPTAKV